MQIEEQTVYKIKASNEELEILKSASEVLSSIWCAMNKYNKCNVLELEGDEGDIRISWNDMCKASEVLGALAFYEWLRMKRED